MQEIIRFLTEHPPFSLLPLATIQRIAGKIQIEYFGSNVVILAQGGIPGKFLYIVRRGSVDLLRARGEDLTITETLGEGETFGYVSLIRGQPPVLTVRAREEVLAYLLPAALFHQLRRDYPVFELFFARSVAERLNSALQSRSASAAPDLFQTRLGDLVRRAPITIDAGATVRDAAQRMHEQNVSCLLIDQDPPGILTDRDLRNRVLAAGRPDTTPVAEVMTSPALTQSSDSLVFEALLTMLERGIHHLPVVRGRQLIGVVTHTDVLRRQSRSPLLLPRQLERAGSIDDLRSYTDQAAETIAAMIDSGARISDIGRVAAVMYDALMVHLLRRIEQELGPPPCAYAWLVLGSGGRREQTLRTDQDHALVYAEDLPEAEPYFAQLAALMVERLELCGFPRCPGDIMASNPRWRQPLAVWQRYFREWIDVPDEEALLQVAIFFDYRQIYGALNAEAGLRPIILRAREQCVFLGRLARAALRNSVPLNFFRQFVVQRKGEHHDVIDIKMNGAGMVVDLARIFALEAGVAAAGTLDRLRGAAGTGSLSPPDSEELQAAFETLNLLRLNWQRRLLARGDQPSNDLVISALSTLERRNLKEALRAIDTAQKGLDMAFQTARMG